MLTAILLILIGVWLEAPAWYFVLCGLIFTIKLIKLAISMYKLGGE